MQKRFSRCIWYFLSILERAFYDYEKIKHFLYLRNCLKKIILNLLRDEMYENNKIIIYAG